MKNLATAFLALLVLTATTAAHAKPGEHSEKIEKFIDGRVQKLIKELNLTEDQAKQVKEIRSRLKPTIKEKRTAKREAMKELAGLMKADGDEAKIRDAYSKLQVARSEAEKSQFEMMLELRRVLSPEQRQKFRDLIGERRKGFRAKMRDKLQDSGIGDN